MKLLACANLTPLELLMRLPADRPVFMLHSGACMPPFARYSLIAMPHAIYRFTDRSEFMLAPGADESLTEAKLRHAAGNFTHDPLRDLESLLEATRSHQDCELPLPFSAGWIGCFSYELGAVLEPAGRTHDRAARAGDWPIVELGWCPRSFVYDNLTREWIHGTEDLRSEISDSPVGLGWRAGALQPTVPREAHIANVARTIEHILAGDIFQANITQQFTAPFAGSTRSFARAALDTSGAWYGAMLELMDGRTIISMSPELFLAVDAKTRGVTTRPIKGTRPRKVDPCELERSEKDKAELAMIVDLMRNDLGRVCEIGSVRVPNPRAIETHGLVHQGVGEVTGTLCTDVSFGELLRATFPPGSVTGAPKIRAMQIIDDLEASPRGPYCGAIGFISGNGDITLNVAIRTIALQGARPANRFDSLAGQLSYGAGGGIVVDSDPGKEFEEALDKTAMLRDLLKRGGRA